MSVQWGEEESQLRMAVFVAFVNNQDTLKLRKKTKRQRQSIVRRASMQGSLNSQGGVSPVGRSARRFSEFKKSLQSSPTNSNSNFSAANFQSNYAVNEEYDFNFNINESQ